MLRVDGQTLIPDTHIHPAGWGIRPIAFSLGGRPVTTYALFVALGLVAAVLVYYLSIRKLHVGNDGLYIAAAAAVGGIVGAKLPLWIANYRLILAGADPQLWLSGRTIVGGLLGGALAVWWTKRRLGITRRLGNYLVAPVCIALFFGRIGCFLTGCCYGVATSLPWGVNFGDGIARHPTQLYEALLVAGLFAYALVMKDRYAPGVLFRVFMIVYFGWRFLVEFIRVNPVAAAGLTYYQIVAAAVLVYYTAKLALVARERSLA
jgi:phosphatidylglycerol---prolipoprotein diacylglyceryl transferase